MINSLAPELIGKPTNKACLTKCCLAVMLSLNESKIYLTLLYLRFVNHSNATNMLLKLLEARIALCKLWFEAELADVFPESVVPHTSTQQ